MGPGTSEQTALSHAKFWKWKHQFKFLCKDLVLNLHQLGSDNLKAKQCVAPAAPPAAQPLHLHSIQNSCPWPVLPRQGFILKEDSELQKSLAKDAWCLQPYYIQGDGFF